MNLQSTKNTAARVYTPAKNTTGTRNFNRNAGIVVTLLFFCLGFALVLIGHLHLCQLSMRSAENSIKLEKELRQVQAETQHLRNRCAALTGWSHIQKKMQDFKMNLVPAAPGQIVRIGIYTPKQASAIPLKQLTVASLAPVNSGRTHTRR